MYISSSKDTHITSLKMLQKTQAQSWLMVPSRPPGVLVQGVLAMNLNTKLINSKDCEDPKHPHKFVVTCGKKGVPFEIVADSQQEKHYWMQAVSKVGLHQ